MADDKKGAVSVPAPDGGDGKKKGNMILVIGIIVGVVVVQAVLAYLIIPKPVDEEAKAQKATEDSLKLVSEAATKMGAVTEDTPIEFVVNISGTDDRFLKAAVVFEYDEKNEALGAELRKRAPTKYKDMLIKHMSSLSFTEITDPSERDKICKDLQRMINASLPAKMGEVRSVMFTMYITQ